MVVICRSFALGRGSYDPQGRRAASQVVFTEPMTTASEVSAMKTSRFVKFDLSEVASIYEFKWRKYFLCYGILSGGLFGFDACIHKGNPGFLDRCKASFMSPFCSRAY